MANEVGHVGRMVGDIAVLGKDGDALGQNFRLPGGPTLGADIDGGIGGCLGLHGRKLAVGQTSGFARRSANTEKASQRRFRATEAAGVWGKSQANQ